MNTIARDVLDILIAGVWQDAGIALIGLTILAVGGVRLSARTRTLAMQFLLATMVLVPLLTTVPKLTSSTIREVAIARAASPPNIAPQKPELRVVSPDGAVLVCAGLWLLGVTLYSLRLLKSTVSLARFVRRCAPIRLRGSVLLLSSPDITVPFAFGFLHPRIMLPQDLVERGGEEFDCIVLHELAHVRHGDAWLNAFERIVQTLLYFNPAIAIVLRSIAIEREAACDDWAIDERCDLDAYVRSLASFALRCTQPQKLPALGVSSFVHGTLKRLQRLEDTRYNRAVTHLTWALGGFSVMLLFIALSFQLFAPSIALASESAQIIVSIDAHDRVQIESKFISPVNLPETFKTLKANAGGRRKSIVIKADPKATYGAILRVMDAAKSVDLIDYQRRLRSSA